MNSLRFSCDNLESVLNQAISAKESVVLSSKKEGCEVHFALKPLTEWNRIKREFGFGNVAPKHVADALLKKKGELIVISNKWWDEGKKNQLALADRFISQIFTKAGMSEQAIDFFEGKYKDWMKDLPEKLKVQKINRINLPGTHDSGSYAIDENHPISDNIINTLCRVIPCVREVVKSWTISQNDSIALQLEDGFRIFDFRLSFDLTEKQFYLSHTFACDPLKATLITIKEFLRKHPQEVVVLTMKPDWCNREGVYSRMEELKILIETELAKWLYPVTETEALPTYMEMIQKRNPIIVIWKDSTPLDSKFIWGEAHYQGHWCDSSDVQTNMDFLINLLNEDQNEDSIFDFSITLTPQTSDVIWSLVDRVVDPWGEDLDLATLTHCFQKVAKVFFTNPAYRHQLEKLCSIRTDFPPHDFVYRIVQLNEEKANKL